MEYTARDNTGIQEYVTHRPLGQSEATTPNEHGVYPVNPIGFPYVNTCDDDAECLGKGNPEFPQGKNFGVSWSSLLPEGVNPPGILANIDRMADTGVVLPVERLETVSVADHKYMVQVSGDIVNLLNDNGSYRNIYFADAGYEKYSITGLVGDGSDVKFTPDEIEFSDGKTYVEFTGTGVTVRGNIGAGRINLVVDVASGEYVLLEGQDVSAENGLYLIQEGTWAKLASTSWYDGEQIGSYCDCPPDPNHPETCEGYTGGENPYCSPASLDNSPTCGHYRHGYSDREVADEVSARCSGIIKNAVHPMSIAGDLTGAGSMTKWFVECGKVALGGSSNGSRAVVIDGFGLGGSYNGECTYGSQCVRIRNSSASKEEPERPWLKFAIGARRPEAGSEVETLPKDWPFTSASSFNQDSADNNITLIKPVVTLTDGNAAGGLESDIYDTCPKCEGTGVFDGHTCPECDGEGMVYTGHQEMNRVHICVNNDFRTDDNGVVVKKTYVHLPAFLDTKDGDEFEITVSMPTLNTENAFSGLDPVDAQRAYYAFISQPRVIVMGGYWKFSDTSLKWTLDAGENPAETGFVIPCADGVLDKDGNALEQGTRVRFTLDGGNNCPRYAGMTGTLTKNSGGIVKIGDLSGYPYSRRLRDRHLSICGMAYLDKLADEQSTLNNFSTTPMGLHSRNAVTLGDDMGDGDTSSLNYHNKFISPKDTGDSRPGRDYVVGDGEDARQILAAVYPTTTSTFPWAVVGRHKMRHLDVLMTDEWDLGQDSVSKMIWKANREILERTDTIEFFGYGEHEYAFTSETMPLRYAVENLSKDVSTIGAQLRITIPNDSMLPKNTGDTYFKLDITDVQGGNVVTPSDRFMQLSEMALYDERGERIPLTYVFGAPGAEYYGHFENPEYMFDGDVTTKWCIRSSTAFVICKASGIVSAKSYTLTTANDCTTWKGRNPYDWTLETLYSTFDVTDRYSLQWKVIDRRVHDTTMQDVNYETYAFEANEPFTVTVSGNGPVEVPEQFPVSSQPVRQARKAARMLAEDFKKLRMYQGEVPGVNKSSKVRYSSDGIEQSLSAGSIFDWWRANVSEYPPHVAEGTDLYKEAWLVKARHLPQYITMAGMDEYGNNTSLIGINPFVDSHTADRLAGNPYENTEYGSSDATETIPCTERIYGEKFAYGFRSIITARIESDAEAVQHELYRDALRVTELQKVALDANFRPLEPYKQLVSDSGYKKWMDIFSATSNVFSIDTVPSPAKTAMPALNIQNTEQYPMVSGEPFIMYKLLHEGIAPDNLDMVSDNLPFYDSDYPMSDALTSILRNMVPPYSSRMPLRWWDSTRVAFPANGDNSTTYNFIYTSRLDWAEEDCGDGLSPVVRCGKVDDEFISRSDNASPIDPNWNRVTMSDLGTVYAHGNWNAAPMKVTRDWFNRPPFTTSDARFQGPSGYIRIFMKFKFSAQSGRWYAVDYIQAPMSYLSPLYGSAALEETIDGNRIWVNSMCAPASGWKDALMHPYYKYHPMDISGEVIPGLIEGEAAGNAEQENNTDLESSTVCLPRLSRPYLPVENGGLGLNAPVDVNGSSPALDMVSGMTHVNFWCVRKHLRPAEAAVSGADIPGFGYSGDDTVMDRTGGVMGDPVLWGQYCFPKKGEIEYVIPDPMQGKSDSL